MPSIVLLAAALLLTAAGCSRRIVRARSIQPATNILPLGGASATNISVGDLAELPLVTLPPDDVLLLTRPERNELLLQRIGVDSMRSVWKDSLPSVEGNGDGERGLALYAVENRIFLLTAVSLGDSVFTIARGFDAGTGQQLFDSVLSGAEPSPELPAESRIFHASLSPGRSYAITYVTSRQISPNVLTVDLQILSGELKPLASKRIRFEHDVDETLRGIEVSDSGVVYLISQNERNSIKVTRLGPQEDAKPERLVADFPEATAQKATLMRPTLDMRSPDAPRILTGSSGVIGTQRELTGIAVATFDFRKGAVTGSRLVPIPRDTILHTLDRSFTDPFLVTCLVQQGSPTYVMIFEHRSLFDANPNYPRLGDVLMTALDDDGSLKWCNGFRKEQYDLHLDLPRASFDVHRTADGMIRFSYALGDTLSLREYRAEDGSPWASGEWPVLTVRRDATRLGYVLRPTFTWINDHTALTQVATIDGDEEDVKLCRIRY